ncbi:MAG: glycoside hydrolase family 140 protein [Prolixibacteraceae bacterium]
MSNRKTAAAWAALMLLGCMLCVVVVVAGSPGKRNPGPGRLVVSKENPHLLETEDGKPVFLNNYTVWQLLRNGSREDIREFAGILKQNKYNVMSLMILDLDRQIPGQNFYGDQAFEAGENGLPDPAKPVTTAGSNPLKDREYDFWDHLDYVIETAAKTGLYVSLHPAWGDWFSGKYSGEPDSAIIFNEKYAYQYGYWLGKRYRDKHHIIWMLGGDRSAVYDEKTRGIRDRIYDYRAVYPPLAEGLADGTTEAPASFDGQADYSKMLISYHPRKWAPNSSEWFHNAPWLTFNSIQDTPYDQFVSMPHDYNLQPVKPSWLYEGRYEKAITAWGVRYQAYQITFSGAFGHTYGAEEMWKFPSNWKELTTLPGGNQMKYLYLVAREIWTDKEYRQRTPDQSLIIGDQGLTIGDGITTNDGDGGGKHNRQANGHSDRITAMRARDGSWALVYTANGRDIHLDLQKLTGKLNAYWFNPRNGMWWVDGKESAKMTPFKKRIKAGSGDRIFDTPGNVADENDWVLLLKRKKRNRE